ncbi:MAG: orotidine-5'-phosphate decarboxylase [Alphaproteobacteria bacterium]|nr:orotidine-5'-phosphate decarboxylase [Alphaproteobacteria bacterium]
MFNFTEQFEKLSQSKSPFCLGVDPSSEILNAWQLPDTAEGLSKFCESLLTTLEKKISLLKPQIAFFERFGGDGWFVLKDFIEKAHKNNILILLDAKRGDIGSTSKAYADGLLGPNSYLKADALTVNPYLGFGSLSPFLDQSKKDGTGIFVVVASSNPDGIKLQQAQLKDGRTIMQHLLDEINLYNQNNLAQPLIGAVIGATRRDLQVNDLSKLGNALVLCPGIGAQGASIKDLETWPNRKRLIPIASRSLLVKGPTEKFKEDLDLMINQSKKLWQKD